MVRGMRSCRANGVQSFRNGTVDFHRVIGVGYCDVMPQA